MVFNDPADYDSIDNTYVAAWPISPDPTPVEGTKYMWDADDPEKVGQFFKDFIVENWGGISRG